MASEEDEIGLDSVFTEEPRPPSPEPTEVVYAREDKSKTDWTTISVRLVGSHPLWGHYLWNAARALASYLDEHSESMCKGKCVLELGAGGGLPGIVAAKLGAEKVVLTDYPDESLVGNMRWNVKRNNGAEDVVVAKGYIWGQPVDPLLKETDGRRFDLVILSDLVFNHSQHSALLKSCAQSLARDGSVLVFYTHHRPHLAHRDMEFFEKAKAQGWRCTKAVTRRFPPMFAEDPGDEEVRATVHGWKMEMV